MKALTQEEFIEKVIKVFPEYDFSKAIYNGNRVKVQVGCKHGYWFGTPHDLYRGHTGCKICAIEKHKEKCTSKITQEIFLERVTKIFPDYDFSKAVYVQSKIKVLVGCKRHNTWWYQSPAEIFYGNRGCEKCQGEHQRELNLMRDTAITQDKFINRVTKIFPEYDFGKAIYKGYYEKVQVGCKHGYWWGRPIDLFYGHTSCEKCSKEKIQNTNLKKYGAKYPLSSLEIQEKAKKTLIKKYGVEYISSLPEVIEKKKNTCLKKYGVENPMSSLEIQEKAKKTLLKNYGVEHPTQVTEIKEKIKRTNLERYGVECTAQSIDVQEKIKRTNLERYGVEHPIQATEIKEKIKQTNLERYGVENSFASKEIQEKIRQTNINRLGVEYPTQSQEVREKIIDVLHERYGVENPSQSQEFREKALQTNIERFGTKYPNQYSV